ncbi:tetratricopeptide repeat protein [Tenacibaculum sp. 190130A14a]
MKKISKILVFAVIIVVTYSCSVKKDSFINRNFHALTTKYNVLFNGEQAFLKGLEEIEQEHKDNFWKRLQIEPITFDERKIASPVFQPGTGFDDTDDSSDDTSKLTSFDKAEDKARKAIETHSMNINGYEKNRQIDDAYLLLGKSRYYTQRFIPAIDAFNYIIANYPKANLIYETKIWRAKANIRLDNEKFAIESLKLLIDLDKNEKTLSDLQREQAHTAMAMAYEKTDTIQKVIDHLKLASRTFKNADQSARNMFILGQVYSELDRKDSATMVFRRLSDLKKAPYKYRIRANIELAKNVENDSAALGVLYRLRKLIRNSDNRKFLASLYYQAGVLEQRRGATDKAVEFFKKSIKAKNNTKYQKTYAYESLGNIAFQKEDYLLAGSYYDSVLQNVSKDFDQEKRIRRIKRKNKGLTTLKKYEDLVTNNDSILDLVAMNKAERTAFFEAYIEKIKKEDEDKRQQLLNSQNFGNSFGGGNSVNTNNSGKWYFYSNQTIAFGRGEFQRVWGNRPLEDNWRISDKSVISDSSLDELANSEEKVNKRYELSTYLDAIPTDATEIEKLKIDRNEALYQLGLIYKEQFKNNKKAIQNLERLQKVKKDNELELPINYHLYQLYTRVNDNDKADTSKNIILTKYPETTFAQILLNPEKKIDQEKNEDEDEEKYKELYYLYKESKFEEVVNQIDNYTPSKANSELIPKFALLKALAIGKYQDKEAYKKALNFVALSYANTEAGEKAKQISQRIE